MKIKSLLKGYFYISGLAILMCFIVYCFNIKVAKLNENEFMFSFLGVLLSVALTLYTFIIGLFQNILDKASSSDFNPTKKSKIQELTRSFFEEINDNILFIFQSLVLVSLIFIIEKTATPYLDVPYINSIFSKPQVIAGFRLSVFSLNMFAIYDLIKSAFKISEAYNILNS